jgi:hypothetical protein
MMRAALLVAAVMIAGCALKAPPTHTDVVEQALPKATRIPPAWRADPHGGEVTNDWLKSFNDATLEARRRRRSRTTATCGRRPPRSRSRSRR